jgi:hypothetical protein
MASESIEPSKKSAPEEKGKGSTKRASAAGLIEAFAQQYQADRQQTDRREGHRIFREWLTIIGLFLAAGIAVFQWRELRSTDHNIAEQARIAADQFKTMQDQLAEMRGTSAQTDKLIDANQKLADASVKQAEAATTSASAANASVDLAGQTAERQLRAYINVETVKLDWKNGVQSSAEVAIRNAGQTPANNVVVRGVIASSDEAAPNRLPAYFGNNPSNFGMVSDSSKVTKILGQGRQESYGIYSSTGSKSKGRKPPPFPGRVFVVGAIYYNDIFGKRRYTRLCVYYLNPINWEYCAEHNDVN